MEKLTGYIMSQKGKKFAVVCNGDYAQVVLSVEGAVEEGTTIPLKHLSEFAILRSFDVDQEKQREGGQHCNINVLDRETLLDAQKHPEKYPQLCVRVSGYCIFWNKLNKEQQVDVIDRTFHSKF